MSGNNSGSSYRRVPTSETGSLGGSSSLPAPNTSDRSSRGARFLSRGRTRWIAIGGITLFVFFLVYAASSPSDADSSPSRGYSQRLRPSNWGVKGANPFLSSSSSKQPTTYGEWNDQQFDQDGWIKGSGRKNLTYNSPFNRDDYSLTEDECDAFFPGLWTEIERSVDYFTTRQK